MILHPKPTVTQLFAFWRLSILPRIARQIAGIAILSALITVAAELHPALFKAFSVAPFTLLGIALSIFLGFRNSACYDRWWEARRQLGALIGECRSLARLLLATSGGDRVRRDRSVRHIITYVNALMAHLRGESSIGPNRILQTLAVEFAAMHAAGEIGEILYMRLDERLSAFAAIQVACERIRSTPTPFTYTLLLHRTAYAFCFLLPFGLVGTLGYATPVFSAVVAYAFFGLDELGSELEEPFGPWLNALPLSAMARTVEISLLEALGDPDIPPPLTPVNFILT